MKIMKMMSIQNTIDEKISDENLIMSRHPNKIREANKTCKALNQADNV